MVEKTKYPKNISALLHPNFIKSVCALNELEICFRNSWKLFNQGESPDNFIFNLISLI